MYRSFLILDLATNVHMKPLVQVFKNMEKIAVGSHGCIKLLSDRSYFVSGLEYVVSRLEPHTLVVYGAAPDKIFAPYREKGIEVLQFDSDFMKSRKAVSA